MNRKIRRIFSIVLVACMLLSLVPLHATSLNEEEDSISNELVMDDEDISIYSNAEESNNTESELSSEQEISSSTISEEIIEELKTSENKKPNSNIIEDEKYIQTYSTNKLTNNEIDMSGWRLSLAIQDDINRWTDNVDWKADNDYSEEKVIKYQITYENDSIPQEYAPGDLSIVIPRIERIINPTYPIYEKHHENGSTSTVYSYFEINIAADNKSDTIKKFDWSYEIIDENYVFTNNNVIDNSSLQGTIQLSYGIKARELPNNTDFSVNAVMNNSIESNSVSFKFNATERTANSSIIAKKLTYNDKYSNDFIYILYNYEISTYDGMGFLPINTHSIKMDLDLPNGCKIYDTLLNELNKIDGYYSLDKTSYKNYDNKNRIIYSAIIAYPIELYTDKVIKSNIKFFAEHKNIGIYVPTEEDYCINNIKLVASSEININTADFYFNYTGADIGITKRNSSYSNDGACSLDYTNITTNSESSEWAINSQVTGISDCSIRLGDDCLIAQNQDGEYVFLNDDEYYISSIKLPRIYNQDDVGYADSTVNIDVYVRYAGEDEYVFYSTVKNGKYNGVTFSRERKDIVGFYIELKNLTNGLKTTEASYGLRPQIVIKKSDIANNSRIYNFAYIQVFDKNGNIINVPDITNYDGSCLSYGIPQKDLDNYGMYMQRAVSWQNIKDIKGYLRVENSSISNMTQEPQEEKFTNTLKISPYIYRNSDTTIPSNLNGFETYIYLAEGMKPDGNLYIDSPYKFNSIKHNGLFFKSEQEYIDFIHNHMKVEIDENAKDASGKYTNRVMIKIIFDFSDEPLDYTALIESTTIMSIYRNMFKINVPVKISYDDYIIYGSSYKTNAYIYPIDDTLYTKKDTSDFNLNGNLTEGYCDSVNITSSIISSISTQQDVQVSVLTEKTNGLYISSTKTPTESSLDSEYIYRLRVRTGQNNVTNLVIYDSIEESAKNSNGDIVPAYGSKDHWHGEFLGIDTSYAESKGYVVKPFYSENPLAGNLYNDDGSLNADWKEYVNDDTDIYEYGEPETITSPNWPSNYNANMTEASNYWEIHKPGGESLEITFDSTCKLESASYDYLRFYDKNGNNITSSVCGISTDKIGGTDIAGKTYTIPGDYVKITMRTDGSGQYKGFLANVVSKTYVKTVYATDKSKVKALAFEYLDAAGNAAILPANSLTYVLIRMKSPADENITSLAYNGCRTQWQALDDFGQPVDFITGINSNIVKVSLPNSIEDKAVNLHFNKTIDGTDEAFNKLKLDKEDNYNFYITLENQDTGDIIKGLVNNKEGFTVNNIPVGTYIIRELDDIWFQFLTMALNESVEGIEFKEEAGNYVIIINASVETGTTVNIEVTNKTDEERFYDNKYDVKNLFSPTI